jgi:hypothetical protein
MGEGQGRWGQGRWGGQGRWVSYCGPLLWASRILVHQLCDPRCMLGVQIKNPETAFAILFDKCLLGMLTYPVNNR